MEELLAVLFALGVWLLLRKPSSPAPVGDADEPSIDFYSAIDGTIDGNEDSDMDSQPSYIDMAKDLIRQSEGFSATATADNGKQQIGYGHDLLPGESYPDGITADQAEALLDQDVKNVDAVISNYVRVDLAPNQRAALIDWTYNLGAGRLATSTLLQEINAGNFSGAAQQILRWIYNAGKPSDGLLARRQAEVNLWNGSQDSSEG